MKTEWDETRAGIKAFMVEAKKNQQIPRKAVWALVSIAAVIMFTLMADVALDHPEYFRQRNAQHEREQRPEYPSRHATPSVAIAYRTAGEPRNEGACAGCTELAGRD